MRFKIWISFFVITFFVSVLSYLFINADKSEIDTSEIQNTLYNKKELLIKQVDVFEKIALNEGVGILFHENTKNLTKQNFIILFFEDDSLTYWSDNSISTYSSFSKNKFIDNKVVSFNNAWFWVYVKTFEKHKIVGLILLKHEYEYENKFLSNKFYLEGENFKNVHLSNVPSTEGANIEDGSSEFLFSIVPCENSEFETEYLHYVFSISFILWIIFFLILIYILLNRIFKRKNSLFPFLGFILLLFTTRFGLQYFHFPEILYQLDIFVPSIYASSKYFPSLGDLLITAIFIFTGAVVLNIHFRNSEIKKTKNILNGFWSAILIILSAIFLFFVTYIISSLILNSSILLEVYKVMSINYLSFIAFFIISIVLISFILFLYSCVKNILRVVSPKVLSYIFLAVFIALILIQWVLFNKIDFISLAFFTISYFLILYVITKSLKFRFPIIASFIFVLTVFSLTVITTTSNQKEKDVRKVLAINLANERDPVAEILLEEFENDIYSDKNIVELINSESFEINDLHKYFSTNFFHGFWSKYDFQLTVCADYDSLVIENSNEVFRCYDFFYNIVNEDGIFIPSTNFYFLDNVNGRISYLGILKFQFSEKYPNLSLYIELDSKLISKELGYPDLLLEDKMRTQQYLDEYSYAKYRKNEMLTKRGDFSYSLNLAYFGELDNEFTTIDIDGYNHLLYKMSSGNVIIISIPTSDFFDIIVSFSYIFSLFLLLWLLYFIVQIIIQGRFTLQANLRFKIQFSMISILLMTLIVIGGGTVFYNIEQFENKQFENISEKAQSISIELEHKLGDFEYLSKEQEEFINYYLVKFSNVFYSDINLYDLNGNLLASSRPEIFKKGLVGTKMNTMAFNELILNRKSEFLHDENIGDLSYLSAYTPFYNNHNKLLGYINLPYFAKQNILKKEISTLVAAIINIYVFLILITIFIALAVSNNITKPLSLLMQKFREVKIGERNEPISYHSDDEIGSLVKEYNRMVEELEMSVEKLASSERESAWREMAKQIAHEIKNPLTPMKLSVQHLQRTWSDDDPEWEKRLNKFSKTLIDQIDSLSLIATEFSNFAKMPEVKREIIQLIPLVEASTNLYKENDETDIILNIDCEKDLQIIGDSEQLLRVFNNVIKNAIQAIPEGRQGQVGISIFKNDDKKSVIVAVEDNGIGIDEEMGTKLFMPNFTTKTSGMGLGLAIVKGIVEMLNGKIWYKTKKDEGSTFFIEFTISDFY